MTQIDRDILCSIVVDYRDTAIMVEREGHALWHANSGIGGVDLIIAFMDHMKSDHDLLIGRPTAEMIARKMCQSGRPVAVTVSGRSPDNSYPHTCELSADEVSVIVERFNQTVANAVQFTFSGTIGENQWPPPLTPDVREALHGRTVLLKGEFGGLYGLARKLQHSIGYNVIADT